MIVVVLLFLIVSLPRIVSQSEHPTVPLRFNEAIKQLLQRQRLTLDDVNYESYSITPAEILAFISPSSSNNTTTKCEQDFVLLVKSALRRERWALKLLDSWGKPLPSGLLKGNNLWVGNYDECLDPLYQPENRTFLKQMFDGQYFLPRGVRPQQSLASGLILGICVPSSCDRRSIVSLIGNLFNQSNMTENNLLCSNAAANKQQRLSGGAIATCVVLSLLGFLVLIGTIIDLVLVCRLPPVNRIASLTTESSKSSDIELTENKLLTLPRHSRCSIRTVLESSYVAFIAEFSAIRTLRRTFTMKKKSDNDSFDCLNGLRVLSLFWVIFGHTITFCLIYTSNIVDGFAWSHSIAFQLVISSMFSVDTFFVLSGFLTAILFAREVAKKKLSLRLFILYYIHRYIRLTPTFVLVMLVSINLSPYFGRGPLYPSVQGFESTGCIHRGWWASILYVGNLVNINDMCLDVSWYLYNDMQFHWVAPLALIPFVIGRKPIAFIVASLFVLVGIGSILGILLYYPNMEINRIAAAMQTTGPTLYEKVYLTPWCRISPYAIGLLTGFIVYNTGRSYRSNIYTKIFGSILAIVIGLTCIFVLYPDYAFVPGISRSANIAHQTLSRSFWALVIGWLLFLCSTNQGGIVNTILSWSIWSPLARLNYSAYLIHTIILFITIYNQSMPYYFQPHLVLNSYISNLFFVYVAATVSVIFFETPFVVLEKKLFKR
ncbi:unnamed protein product [Rotaria sp. Silwood1]|nr:unnamed protein product [Rotaria sp. Silwood1]